MGFMKPKIPPAPAMPPPPPNAPTLADANVTLAGMSTRQRVGGVGSTIATGGMGVLAPASLAGKSLLGS